jgi:hypothetical protein
LAPSIKEPGHAAVWYFQNLSQLVCLSFPILFHGTTVPHICPCFHCLFILRLQNPSRWRHYIPVKCWDLLTLLQSVTSQKIRILWAVIYKIWGHTSISCCSFVHEQWKDCVPGDASSQCRTTILPGGQPWYIIKSVGR